MSKVPPHPPVVTVLNRNWREHVITSLRPFAGRTVGSLSEEELKLLRDRWMPAVTVQWDKANPEQRADYHALVNAIGEEP